MPKIRQAIAVLAAATFCIAFNTYRYPAVREMVAAISSSAQSAEANPTEKVAAAEKTHDGTDAGTSKPPAGVVCKDGVCTMPLPDSPSASLSSTPPDDAASPACKQTDEKPAWPAESADGAESKSKPPEDGESTSSAPDQAESSPKDEVAKPESNDPPAESAGQDASAKPDPHSTPAHGSPGESLGRKLGAKLVSTFGGSSTPPTGPGKPPAARASLIPISRPASRTKGAEMAAAKLASDFKLPGEQGPRAQGVRHLPAVDPVSGADTPSLIPDLMRTYPVTSAK